MNRPVFARELPVLALALLVVLSACGDGADAGASGSGVATVKVADWEWRVEGTCESAGDDMTFTAPGDPMLSVGFNSAGKPTAVGNLSSVSKGFISFIGHPEVPQADVAISGNTYTVSGPFFVDVGVSVAGDISITCG